MLAITLGVMLCVIYVITIMVIVWNILGGSSK